MTIRARSALVILFCLSLQTTRLRCQTQPPPQSDQKSAPTTPVPRANPNANGIYHVADGVTAPKLIYSVEPEFSEQARQRKLNAKIGVHFIVGTDGHVRDVTVTKSAADSFKNQKDREAALTLDQQAIKAASQYRFVPGQYQGKAVPVELTSEVFFNIF